VKSQYFGDINDYLKCGLLPCFCAAGFRLTKLVRSFSIEYKIR
jgi:hypothetical protein